jgi:hypothetical protein
MLGAVVPVTPEIGIRFGAFGGPEFLFADSDSAQGRDSDAYEGLCNDLGSGVECDVSSATSLALTYGFHAGPTFRLSSVNTLGAELLVQRADIGLFEVEAAGSAWRAKQSYDYSAWRLWLVLNVGVGK